MNAETLILTAAETAKLLRLNAAETLRRLETGEITATRDGRGWKVPKSLLIAYIENKAIKETQARREAHEKIQMEQGKI